MAHKNQKEYDGCGNKEKIGKDMDAPKGWTFFSVILDTPGKESKAIDLCASCSKDPEAGAKRYKDKFIKNDR
jgi:hypothetical protein